MTDSAKKISRVDLFKAAAKGCVAGCVISFVGMHMLGGAFVEPFLALRTISLADNPRQMVTYAYKHNNFDLVAKALNTSLRTFNIASQKDNFPIVGGHAPILSPDTVTDDRSYNNWVLSEFGGSLIASRDDIREIKSVVDGYKDFRTFLNTNHDDVYLQSKVDLIKKTLVYAKAMQTDSEKIDLITTLTGLLIRYDNNKLKTDLDIWKKKNGSWHEPPSAALSKESGVCTEFAAIGAYLARAVGYPASDVFLVCSKDSKSGHLQVAVRIDANQIILINPYTENKAFDDRKRLEHYLDTVNDLSIEHNAFAEQKPSYAVSMEGKVAFYDQRQTEAMDSAYREKILRQDEWEACVKHETRHYVQGGYTYPQNVVKEENEIIEKELQKEDQAIAKDLSLRGKAYELIKSFYPVMRKDAKWAPKMPDKKIAAQPGSAPSQQTPRG